MCFKYNCCPRDMNKLCKKNNLPNFYVELFNIWSGLKYMNVHRVKDIANEIIWNNSNINFRMKCYCTRNGKRQEFLKLQIL